MLEIKTTNLAVISMKPIDIIIISLVSLFALCLLIYFIIRIKNHKGLSDCPKKDDLKIYMKVYKHNKKKEEKKKQKELKKSK